MYSNNLDKSILCLIITYVYCKSLSEQMKSHQHILINISTFIYRPSQDNVVNWFTQSTNFLQ